MAERIINILRVYTYKSDGSKSEADQYWLMDDGRIGSTNQVALSEMEESGIPNYVAYVATKDPKRLGEWIYPFDGITFLENLRYRFRSPYYIAAEIEDA